MDVTSEVEEESGSVASVVETESMSVFKSELEKYLKGKQNSQWLAERMGCESLLTGSSHSGQDGPTTTRLRRNYSATGLN